MSLETLDAEIWAALPEGWTFGYIGNVYGMAGTLGWRDDLFGPENVTVPRDERNVGGLRTAEAYLLLAAAQSIAKAPIDEDPMQTIRAARAAVSVARRALPVLRIVRLKKEGLFRVLDGEEGMTFIVDAFTDTVDRRGQIAHVRDYRKHGPDGTFHIWSIGPEGYEEISK